MDHDDEPLVVDKQQDVKIEFSLISHCSGSSLLEISDKLSSWRSCVTRFASLPLRFYQQIYVKVSRVSSHKVPCLANTQENTRLFSYILYTSCAFHYKLFVWQVAKRGKNMPNVGTCQKYYSTNFKSTILIRKYSNHESTLFLHKHLTPWNTGSWGVKWTPPFFNSKFLLAALHLRFFQTVEWSGHGHLGHEQDSLPFCCHDALLAQMFLWLKRSFTAKCLVRSITFWLCDLQGFEDCRPKSFNGHTVIKKSYSSNVSQAIKRCWADSSRKAKDKQNYTRRNRKQQVKCMQNNNILYENISKSLKPWETLSTLVPAQQLQFKFKHINKLLAF